MRSSFAGLERRRIGSSVTAGLLLSLCGGFGVGAASAQTATEGIPAPQWLGARTRAAAAAAPVAAPAAPVDPALIPVTEVAQAEPVVPAVVPAPRWFGSDAALIAAGVNPPPATGRGREAEVEFADSVASSGLPPFAATPLGKSSGTAIRTGAIAGAYTQLAPLEEQYAGDPDFDYALGLAAMGSGAESEAVFSLQRASLARPGALGVRLDLARAYYAIGDYRAAETEFRALQTMNPPPQVAALINDYLVASRQQNAKYNRRAALLVNLESGFDTNANSATDIATFEGFQLSPTAREQDSGYAGAGVTGNYSRPMSPRWRLRLNGGLDSREYFDFEEASRVNLNLGFGGIYERGSFMADVGVLGTQVYLDGEDNVRLYGVDGNLSGKVQGFRLNFGGRISALRFADALNTRDVDQFQFRLGGTRVFAGQAGLQMGLALVGGRDEAVEDQSPNSRDTYGINLTASAKPWPRTRLRFRVGAQEASYDDPFFGRQRDDTQLSAEIGLSRELRLLPKWRLRLNTRWLDNDSSVDVFSYDRLDAGLHLQRIFQ